MWLSKPCNFYRSTSFSILLIMRELGSRNGARENRCARETVRARERKFPTPSYWKKIKYERRHLGLMKKMNVLNFKVTHFVRDNNFGGHIWIQKKILFLIVVQFLTIGPFFNNLWIFEIYEIYLVNSMISDYLI